MKRTVAILLLGASVVLLGVAAAKNETDSRGEGEVGRYTVSGNGDGAILLDTTTGKTWVLWTESGIVGDSYFSPEHSGWVAAPRFETHDDLFKWSAEFTEKYQKAREAGGLGDF